MSLATELSADEGYFRFGDNVCFGQTRIWTIARRRPRPLRHAARRRSINGDGLLLPFDPRRSSTTCASNSYTTEQDGMGARRETLWRQPYYALRPLIPGGAGGALWQRLYLRDWRRCLSLAGHRRHGRYAARAPATA